MQPNHYSLAWPFAHGGPKARALFKTSPDDFFVHELFTNGFSGDGEHILLHIEKRGLNTEDLVKSLARAVNKPVRALSYAGLKDRQSTSTQWISIHAPGEDIAGLSELNGSGWRVLEHTRHNKKIRPGYLAGNKFIIRLKNVSDINSLIEKYQQIELSGVPNYFGEQRFGRDAGNLYQADEVLTKGKKVKDRFLKGLYFSAARSWVYNQILAQRVLATNWNKAISGDVMQLSGTHSIFKSEEQFEELNKRISERDISPASPMPGKGDIMAYGESLALINDIYSQWSPWIKGLQQQGLEQAWRANILYPKQMEYQINGQDVELSFVLPAGAYATVVLREMVNYWD